MCVCACVCARICVCVCVRVHTYSTLFMVTRSHRPPSKLTPGVNVHLHTCMYCNGGILEGPNIGKYTHCCQTLHGDRLIDESPAECVIV